MRKINVTLCALLAAACAPAPPEETPVQSAAAVMMQIPPGTSLDSLLFRLDEHLVAALTGRMEGEAVIEFRRAEAITDRLLEARLPFEWIPDEQYSLQSRLRQIQSAADRVLAYLDTGAPRDTMLMELRVLRDDVVALRQTVARGGARAPPRLDQLMRDTAALRRTPVAARPAGQDTAARPAAAPPLGTPVRPDTVPAVPGR
jgi:hypothetical protein